ncbi:MAG: hypothetical protein M1822_004513 [Bathelium mastoideum]|nr:MAG: hypothetical protein M1822_004513 [Bathelium mastoideum]
MASVRRIGFTRLFGGEGNNDQRTLNVVFIHGLRGHPRRTWEAAAGATNTSDATEKRKGLRSLLKERAVRSPSTSTEQAQGSSTLPSPTVFWPEEYLASDLPQAQLWTYGYNADVVGGLFQANNQNSISNHGRNLSVKLEREINNEKPIAFVVHSLGGVIIKDAIRRSEKIRNRTKLIIFLGTPHRGSPYAGWGQAISNLARVALQDSNKKLLQTLEVNSEVLDNIHEEFKTIASKGLFKIHSFQEARGIVGMKGLDQKVVDDFSSKLDLPNPLEIVESIDANHMQMARYSSNEDEGYIAVSGILREFVRQESGSQQTSPANVPNTASSDVLFMVPFPKDNSFIGREDIIANLSEHRAASQAHTRVALVGLGGVGKSQIVIEYAYRIRKAVPQTLVIWIHASNPTRFNQGYREFADKVSLTGRESANADILQLVSTWLSDERNGQWLMILDNVDDDDVFFSGSEDTSGSTQTIDTAMHGKPLETFLPQTRNGMILITSRNRTAAFNLVGDYGDIVQVEPMEEEDALALLQTKVPIDESSRADATALVNALEGVPLAITHAAAYIKMRASTTSVSTYRKLFRESEANQVHLLSNKKWKDLRRHHSARDAVIVTWQISFDQIRKTDLKAADLLALMSMFDKQGIPRSLLGNNTSQLDFDDALMPLLSFSLVRAEIGKQTLEMHRLVQVSIRAWLKSENQLSKWTKESIRTLSSAFPTGKFGTWADCKVLLPHVKEIVSYVVEDKKDLLNQAKTAFNAGWYLRLIGDGKATEAMHQQAVERFEKAHGPEHPETLTSISHFAIVLEDRGKYERAGAMHRKVLEERKKMFGSEHPDTLTSVNNLGVLLQKQGKYEEAEMMHRQVLKEYEKTLGPEHLDTLNSVKNLGSVLGKQGKYEEAEMMHRQVLKEYEKTLGPEHLDTLNSVKNLGSVLGKQGKSEEAEMMHRRVLKEYEKMLGSEHPGTLSSVNNLGLVLQAQGKYEEAEMLHQQVLKEYEKILGFEHQSTLDSASNLGTVLHIQGKYEEAEVILQQVLKGSEETLGSEHPTTLNAMGNLGAALHRQNKFEEAETMYKQAIRAREDIRI